MSASRKQKATLQERVTGAAEGILRHQDYVSPIDLLCRMGLLSESAVQRWRHGSVATLHEVLPPTDTVSQSLALLTRWAESRGMQPVEERYVRATRDGECNLQFTADGLPEWEQAFRTHYVSPAISQRKRRAIVERAASPAERVVYWNLRDAACSECGAEIESGSFLFLDAGEALCLPCANLGELEFLPSGDTALTRRATKYGGMRVVVVRFSRSRKRYERQGILVPEAALRKAEEECAADAGERAAARDRAAIARRNQDAVFTTEMTAKIRSLFPGCPAAEAQRIAAHTALRGSGRVGRSAAGRAFDPQAVTLAVAAAVRHNHTNYDELLTSGIEREAARGKVRPMVDEILGNWSRT
jgi:hypothetical protein